MRPIPSSCTALISRRRPGPSKGCTRQASFRRNTMGSSPDACLNNLFHQGGGGVPGDVLFVEVVQEFGAVVNVPPVVGIGRQVHRETADAVQFHVDEPGGMGLKHDRLVQGGLERGEVRLRRAGLPDHVLEVEESVVALAAHQAVIHLDIRAAQVPDAGTVPVEKVPADVGQGIQPAAVHQGDGGPIHGVVHIGVVVVLADGLHIRDLRFEQMLGEAPEIQARRRNLAGGSDQERADVPQFPGDLHGAHQTGVEQDVVQLVGDGGRQVLDLHLLRPGPGGIILLAERLEPRAPGNGAAPVRAFVLLGIAEVAFRQIAGGVGGEDGAVTGRREFLPDPVEHFRHHLLVGDGRTRRPGLERVRAGLAMLAVQAVDDRGRVLGIDPPVVRRLVAEDEDDILIPPLFWEITLPENVDVAVDVVAQGVEAGLVQEQHLAGFLSERAHGQGHVQAVLLAGAEQQGQDGQEYEPDFRHKNRYVGQS